MKVFKLTAVMMAIILLLTALTACGSVFDGSETPSDETVAEDSSSSGDTAEIANDSSASGTEAASAGGQAATVQEASTLPVFEEVTVTAEDKAANIDKYIGNWEDSSDPSRYCIIKKTEIGYSYTDNESNFPAKVENDKLMIHIELDDAYAEGVVDEAAGTLTVSYNGESTVFKKKAEK